MFKKLGGSGHGRFFKKLSVINGLLLIVQLSFAGVLFINPAVSHEVQAGVQSTMCAQAVDIVLITDRSGSMDYTSRCDSWQLKCINRPSCSLGYKWVKNTTYNQSEAWCNARNQSSPHQSTYLAITPKKIIAAEQAANNFLDLMGADDQSASVSYANTASLDKLLSNNHSATKTAINNLTATGATNIGDAIKLGIGELESTRVNEEAVKAMILLTDGLANKPNGSGYGENPADVAYAENQALIAAGLDFKIFTIGLGTSDEINETMLGNIASTTGAEYYYAPTQNDLEAIYNSIASRLCRYGAVSGCKYSDANKDGIIAGEEKLAGWEIILENGETQTQLTDANGCFKFTGLLPGGYTLSEGGKAGVIYEQTYPPSGFYTFNLDEGLGLENYDFGNYLPVCGNKILDSNYGEACDGDAPRACAAAGGYAGLETCENCQWGSCEATEYCGDGLVNDSEECDGAAGISGNETCSPTCTILNLSFCGDGIKQLPNDLGLGGPANDGNEQCDGTNGVGANQVCEANCVLTDLAYCGDGIKNGNEQCDDGNTDNYDGCKNSCRLPGCQTDVDVMMVLDRSGSMDYTSICEWWQLKCINRPSCSLGYAWTKNITYNQTEGWCAAKNQSSPHEAVFKAYNPVKITAAKAAANNFLNLMGAYDQSGLVSYANSASLDKLLSNNHAATKTAVNSLITGGATDIGDAIKLGAGELESLRANSLANKVMILLTDGMANKPYGPGYGEYPADVAYTEDQAALAAAADIKIFTIGLGGGGDINEIMLTNIAANSGGQYYNAPTGAQLQEIFDQIAEKSCPNYVCGDGISDPGEVCDDGANNGQYGYCQSDCSGQTPATCGNDVKEDTEECDGTDGVGANQSCSASCILTNLPYCGDGVKNGSEQCDDSNTEDGDGCSATCQTELSGIQPGQIIINELAWMGTSSSTVDEWLELRNLTAGELDLGGCQLTRNSSGLETLMLTIPIGKTISANGYFLISNYDKENSHLNIDPDLVENDISLANSNLQIKLYCGGDWNNGGILLDTADDGSGEPLAGSNSAPKKSMQRNLIPGDGTLEDSWCAASTGVNFDDYVTELGTPGALNDCSSG